MKKLFIGVQWIVVVLVAAVLVYGFRQRARPVPEWDGSQRNQWDGFHAISFSGVSRRDDPVLVSRDRLGAILQALATEGYHPIRLADAEAFLRGTSPLPDRAILILFEGGRKDSFLWPTPLLRRLGMRAILAVPTGVTRKWGSFFVSRKDLRYAETSPLWELAAMGDRAVWSIPVDAQGTQGNFLSRRRWGPQGAESDADYQARIENDFAACARALGQAGTGQPRLYVHPFSDDGRNPDADPAAAGVIRKSLEAHFNLGFAGGRHSFNGPQSDPYALSCLSVPGTWSAKELLEALERAEPRRAAAEGFLPEHAWLDVGTVAREGGRMVLNPSSQAWLRGSADWTDSETEMRVIVPPDGWAALCLRHSPRGPSVRVAVRKGWIQVQETVGPRMQTLMREPLPAGAVDSECLVQARVKGRRIWVAVNHGPWSRPLPLTSATRCGLVGLTSDGGTGVFTSFKARPMTAQYAVGARLADLPPETVEVTGAVIPRWWSTEAPPAVSETQRDEILQAAAQGIETIPLIQIRQALAPEAAEAWAGQLTSQARLPDIPMPVDQVCIEGDPGALSAALKNHGWTVHRILSGEEASAMTLPSPDPHEEYVILGPPEKTEPLVRKWLTRLPPDRIAVEGWPVEARPSAIHPVCVFPKVE